MEDSSSISPENHPATSSQTSRLRTHGPAVAAFTARLKKIYSATVRFSLFAVKFFLAASVCLIVVRALMDVVNDKIVFIPFKVVSKLENQGFSGGVLADMIVNRINFIAKTVEKDSYAKGTRISKDSESKDIELPGAGVSLRQITDFLRYFFRTSIRSISGNVVLMGGSVYLTIKVTKNPEQIFKGSLDRLDVLINKSAEYILKSLDPMILAKFYHVKNDHNGLQDLAYYLRDNFRDDERVVKSFLIDGLAYFSQGLYAEALYEWRVAAKKDPTDVLAYLYQGWALGEQQNYSKAIKIYEKAAQLAPENPQIYNNWAIALYNLHKLEDALKKLEILTKLAPDFAKAYGNMAYILFELNRFDEGIAFMKKAIKIDPRNPEFYVRLAQRYLRHRKNKACLAELAVAAKFAPDDERILWLKAEALSGLERYSEAYRYYMQYYAKLKEPDNEKNISP